MPRDLPARAAGQGRAADWSARHCRPCLLQGTARPLGHKSLTSRKSASLYKSYSLSPFSTPIPAQDWIGRAGGEPPRRRRGRQKGWSPAGTQLDQAGEGARTAAVPLHTLAATGSSSSKAVLGKAPEGRGSGISVQTLPASSWPDAFCQCLPQKGKRNEDFNCPLKK